MKKDEALVQLSRLALVGRRQDVQMYIRRMSKSKDMAEIRDQLNQLIHDLPSQTSPVKSRSFSSLPVDLDSRLQLMRFEPASTLDYKPIWTEHVKNSLSQIIEERSRIKDLAKAGLSPTKTVLFVGKPGVGKTLGARWLSSQLGLPLLLLDLSAVMSSFLGRTGTNLRMVLDYAKSTECILLLDEIDAIAKRRDDTAEIGELKRLVTVLLQEIDDWPSDNLMIAATNHPSLLDPAVWRRFESVIEFPLPDQENIKDAINEFFRLNLKAEIKEELINSLTIIFEGSSFSDIEKQCMQLRRDTVLKKRKVNEVIEDYVLERSRSVSRDRRQELAALLVSLGHSQRKISALIGMGRDTVRKAARVVNDES